MEHGAAGYGVYWIIVEILHEETAKKLKQNNLTYVAIARQASTSVEQVKDIVECCLEYGLFNEEDGCFYSERILENIDKRMEISEKRAKAGRISAINRKKRTRAQQKSTSAEENSASVEENSASVLQHPTKERKEKERKGKSIIDTNVSTLDAPQPTQEKIDYKALINFFNDETQGMFGKVIYPISDKRKNSIRARIKDFGKEAFAEMIRRAARSDFLKGDGNKGFVANFDWMIRPTNFQKIIEGNYDNRNKGHNSSSEASDEELMLHIKQGIARGLQENAT